MTQESASASCRICSHTAEVESQTKDATPDIIVFRIRVTDITGVYENH
jgi:hypothetical protein